MDSFETPIAIRAYSEKPGSEPLGARPVSKITEASPWTLVFDCETTIDATQQLRIGFYQVRKGDVLEQEGVFYDRNAITRREFDQVRAYARSHKLKFMTVAAFRFDVFLKYGFTRRCGTVVGFNLPFDLSRIAMRHGPAMRHMRGGFSFQLTRDSDDPRVRVKHLSPRAALIDFATPGDQETPRGMRKRGLYIPTFRGHFVDVKTLAVAILSRRFSLQSLAEFLGTTTQKLDTDEHGTITIDYLDYARTDVQTTWECFHELERRYAQHGSALVLWVDTFWVKAGDKLMLDITGPDGETILKYSKTIEKTQARHYAYAGVRRKTALWPAGVYKGKIRLVRENGLDGREEYSTTREVTLR